MVGATDRAYHDWWKYIDRSHPAYDPHEAAQYGDLILEVYQAADACVGKFLEAAYRHLQQALKKVATNVDSLTMMDLDAVTATRSFWKRIGVRGSTTVRM